MHKTIAALVLALTVSPMAAWAADGPGRGMSKAQVRQQFGKPARVQAPVGNPPIGRWHYPDFTVYFENDIVLHSVSEDRAARTHFFTGTGDETGFDTTDGLRVSFEGGRVVHLRPSGNAPECRCYAEAETAEAAQALVASHLDKLTRALG